MILSTLLCLNRQEDSLDISTGKKLQVKKLFYFLIDKNNCQTVTDVLVVFLTKFLIHLKAWEPTSFNFCYFAVFWQQCAIIRGKREGFKFLLVIFVVAYFSFVPLQQAVPNSPHHRIIESTAKSNSLTPYYKEICWLHVAGNKLIDPNRPDWQGKIETMNPHHTHNCFESLFSPSIFSLLKLLNIHTYPY